MKKLALIYSFLFVAFVIHLNAQTADITATPLSGGTSLGPISFQGNPQIQATAFNFNSGALPTGWTSSPYNVGQPCATDSPSNTNYFWATTTDGGIRYVITNNVDVSMGGKIEFYIRYGSDDPAPGCEDPDEAAEEVNLQYSIDNGLSWVTIYDSWNTVSDMSALWYNWHWNSIDIPVLARTASTKFRWYQPSNSGDDWDNWGLEDVSIGAAISGITSHEWKINGSVVSTSGSSLVHTFSSIGNYTVSYSFTSPSGNGSNTKTYVVNSVPTLDAISNQNANVSGGSQNLSLSGISDGGISGQTLFVTATSNNTSVVPNPVITYTSANPTGTLTYTPSTNGSASITVYVSYNNVQTVTFSRTFTITVNTIPANPTSISVTNNPICSGTSTQLTANGVDGTVYWYTASCGGTATTPATGNTLTVSPSTTTTYYARNYNNSQFSEGCASITITVNPLLQYRTVQSGNWTTLANWEQYNGVSWIAATSYPGQITNSCSSPLVTIRTAHQMQLSGTDITIPNLKVEGTGKLTIESTGKIFVSGQLQLDANASGAIVVK